MPRRLVDRSLRSNKMKYLFALITLLVLASTAYPMTMGKEQFTCPLDGEQFEDYVNYSGTSFGMRLDLKPIGPTPAPWALPTCPKCRFPLYKKEFEADEIKRYRILTDSKEFKSIDEDAPPYFLLAEVKKYDGAPEVEIAYSYLQASWQVEENKKEYQKCIKLALHHYDKDYSESDKSDDKFLTSGILVAELYRQLGEFKKSVERATQLKEVKTDNETITAVLNQILMLSQNSDSEPHQIE